MKLAFPKPKVKRGRGCRVSDRDEAEKERRGYKSPRSFVRLDGSETLKDQDWRLRKAELSMRSGGKCEKLIDGPLYIIGERCRSDAVDPHHLVKRSKGRDDRLNNLIHLCRFHHDLMHSKIP